MTATIPNCILLIWKLANKSQDPEECFSAGLVGLSTAIKYFDSHKGCKFISFAYTCILQSIAALRSRKQRLAKKIKTIQQLFYQKTGTYLLVEQLAVLLNENEAKIHDLLVLDNIISIENLRLDDGQEPILVDKEAPLPYDKLEKSFVAEAVQDILNTLPDEEQQIMKLYYGINLPRSLQQKEIGLLFGITGEAVRRRIINITEKLSCNSKLRVLAEA